jgi:hypothetical protein
MGDKQIGKKGDLPVAGVPIFAKFRVRGFTDRWICVSLAPVYQKFI